MAYSRRIKRTHNYCINQLLGGYWASSEGGFESRLEYLNNCLKGEDDICFVSWIEEDRGKEKTFMREKATFWKCSLEYSTKYYEENVKLQRPTRVDFDKIHWGRHVKTYYEKNYENGYRANFFATDSWAKEEYQCFFLVSLRYLFFFSYLIWRL